MIRTTNAFRHQGAFPVFPWWDRIHAGYMIFAVAWIVLVLVLNGMPGSELPRPRLIDFPHKDKLVHFGMYAVMGMLMWNAFVPSWRRIPPLVHPALAALFLPAVVGAGDELRQLIVPGRSADIMDWLADVAGAAFVVLLAVIKSQRRR